MRSVELVSRTAMDVPAGPAFSGVRAIPVTPAIGEAAPLAAPPARDDHVAVYLVLDEIGRLRVQDLRSQTAPRRGGQDARADLVADWSASELAAYLPTSDDARHGGMAASGPAWSRLQGYRVWLDDRPGTGTLIDARV